MKSPNKSLKTAFRIRKDASLSIVVVIALALSVICPKMTSAQTPPTRQANVGTWAELQDQAAVDEVRAAILAAAGKGKPADRTYGQKFADCAVKNFSSEARSIVVEMLLDKEIKKRFPRVLRHQCEGDQAVQGSLAEVQVPAPLLQMWLADSLIRRDYANVKVDDFSEAGTLEAVTFGNSADAVWTVLSKLGTCIAKSDPEGVRKLALSDVASESEKAAMRQLGEAMGYCLPPGASVKFQIAEIRGAALLSYYRLAQRVGGDAGGRR